MRIIVASLLGSDLTTRELKELADSFTEYTFSSRLSDLLRQFIQHFTDSDEAIKSQGAMHDLEELSFNIIQRRRLPKRKLIELVTRVAPSSNMRKLRSDLTVRQIVQHFFDSASPKEIDDFLQILHEGPRTDAYLKGIIRRN